MKTIFLSLALLGIGLAQGQDPQFKDLINGNNGNGNMDVFMKSFQNLNVQSLGPNSMPSTQDQLIKGGGLLQNPNIVNNMMIPQNILLPFINHPLYPNPQIKPNCPKGCVGKVSKNLIVNGGFEKNKCTQMYCQYSLSTYKNDVQGWQPSPTLQIGYGSIYNKGLQGNQNRVIELDVSSNSCMKQQLVLKSGRYILQFDWAARQGIILDSSKIGVHVNNQHIQSFTPSDYNVNHQRIQFVVQHGCQNTIQFCAEGNSQSYGAVLDNVKLFYLDECNKNI